MKKYLLLFFIGLSFSFMLQAQNNKTINVTAGGLYALTNSEANTITGLTLTGTIDARDFKTMRDKLPLLSKLDLSGATIVAYNGSEGTNPWVNMNYPANKIPAFAFYKDIVTTTLTSIIFPQSITSIGNNAFYNCVGLTDILIPSMVTTIGQEAFYNCNGLKTLFLPSSVISLGSQPFENCNNLTSITVDSSIPPNINAAYVFYQVDKKLCILNVPFKSAGNYRIDYQWSEFQNIKEAINGFNLSSNYIWVDGAAGSNATNTISSNIEWTASSDKEWLTVNPILGTGIQVLTLTAEENPSFMNTRIAYVTVSALGLASQKITITQSIKSQPPKTLEVTPGGLASALTVDELATITDLTITGTIDARDFKTMRDKMPLLAKLNLSGVNIVAYNGIEGTGNIGTTDYPANTIPEYAFVNTVYGLLGKSSLTSIVLPGSLTAIGQYSFSNCYSLTNVIIPSSVINIGSYAFFGCSRISEITIPAAVTTIGILALGKLSSQVLVDPGNLNYMASNNVLFNKAQTELIQFSILIRGNYEIPSTVNSIGDYAFDECLNLTSVTIPSSVTSIGKYAFYYCTGLSTITIPSSVTFIGESAFKYYLALTTIYANSITPVNLNSSPNVFYELYFYSCTLYVPIGSKSAYQAANQWKEFRNIIEFNPDLIANAGPDQTIDEGKLGLLEGSATVNTSGNRVTYKWTAPEGITLSSDTIANPTFTAPEVLYYTNFTFLLTISDGLNYSGPDQVVITVKNVIKPPVANAGKDQSVNETSLVTLDGSASYDPGNNYLYYEWTAPAGISLSSKYISKPTFKAPAVTTETYFTFYLKVNNGYFNKTDSVVITVKQVNLVPIANAGNNQYKEEGEVVQVDGSGSWNPDGGTLTYLWTAPEGITLNSLTNSRASFTAPEVDTDTDFTFTLTVKNSDNNSSTAEVTVRVKSIPPVLKLISNANYQPFQVYVHYKLFKKEADSFILKTDTFAVTGEVLYLTLEAGEWIALAIPARDPSAFIPTYSGDVLNWEEATVINFLNKRVDYMEINCIKPTAASAGEGQISGFVYEKPGAGTNSVTISQTNSTFSKPVQNAMVQLYKKGSAILVSSVFTDSQGAYQFDKLELSDYEIVIELPGYIQSEKVTIVVSAKEPLANAYFAIDTSSKVITDNNSVQGSLIKVYPNPTNGIIHISGLPENIENKISIYTIEGKQVMEKKTHLMNETVDISDQPFGTYLLVVNKERFKILKK